MRRFTLALLTVYCFSLVPPARALTFTNPPMIPTATDPVGLAAADFNHDTRPDLAYVDGLGTRTLHTLLGNSDATFSHSQEWNLPEGVCGNLRCAITIADVTGDGNADLLLGGSVQFSSTITVFVSNGDGTFQPPTLSTFSSTLGGNFPLFQQRFGVGDVNGDGAADVVVQDSLNGQVDTLFGNNTGHFTLSSAFRNFAGSGVYLQDLNGDGALDIVALDRLGGRTLVLLGNGDGTFQTSVQYDNGSATGSMVFADLDGDGRPDVVATVFPAGQIVMLKGLPNGAFANPIILSPAPHDGPLIAVGDYNSDGVRDLLFLTTAGVGVLPGQGNLTFGTIRESLAGNSTDNNIAQGDFNGDTHVDLLLGVPGGIVYLQGNNNGTFQSADFYDIGVPVGAAAVADFNGDGAPDIAITESATFPRLLIGAGHGLFNLTADPNTTFNTQAPFSGAFVGDFNGDGKKDLNVGNLVPNVASIASEYVQFGLGSGTFTAPALVPYGSPVIADFNNDGRSDMVLVQGAIAVSLGQANNTFVVITTPLRNGAPTHWADGDVNDDGLRDLVLNYFDRLEIWLGDGHGAFSYLKSIDETGVTSDGVVITDLDGDGAPDILLAPDSNPAAAPGPLTIFYGSSVGSFQPPVFLPLSHRYSRVSLADLNLDSKPDLVFSDGSSIAVLMNLGARQFDSEAHYVAGQTISYLNVTDVDGDGFPDIVGANPGGSTVFVLFNEPNGAAAGAAVVGTFTVAPEPAIYGQSVLLTLTLSSASPGRVPTGSVSFLVNGSLQATAPLSAGSASYLLATSLFPGTDTLTAIYSGDAVYAPKAFATMHETRTPTYSTQTGLIAAQTTVPVSGTVRLTASVTGNVVVHTGLVTFFDGTRVLHAALVDDNGNAFFNTALLAAGVHSLTAKYQGSTQVQFLPSGQQYPATLAVSTSPILTLTVTDTATVTTLLAAPSSPKAGALVTLSANVSSGVGVPFGGVTFYDNTVVLGTSSLKADGSASFSTASLGVGTHHLQASYNANASFAGSSSSSVDVSVTNAASGSIATAVALSAQLDPSAMKTTLVATVATAGKPAAGVITFLDAGSILGQVPTDVSGTALLRLGMLPSGTHSLTASFEGASPLAPGVSPQMEERWPESGPGFTLGIDRLTSPVSLTDPMHLKVDANPGFTAQVALSCDVGLPPGYFCVFSPGSIDGDGTSSLLIRRSAEPRAGIGTIPWRRFIIPAVIFILLLLWLSRMAGTRRARLISCGLACFSLAILAGCTTASVSGPPSDVHVVTIRASAGSNVPTIVHSAQVAVDFSTLK